VDSSSGVLATGPTDSHPFLTTLHFKCVFICAPKAKLVGTGKHICPFARISCDKAGGRPANLTLLKVVPAMFCPAQGRRSETFPLAPIKKYPYLLLRPRGLCWLFYQKKARNASKFGAQSSLNYTNLSFVPSWTDSVTSRQRYSHSKSHILGRSPSLQETDRAGEMQQGMGELQNKLTSLTREYGKAGDSYRLS
jgi:hypothetical protein